MADVNTSQADSLDAEARALAEDHVSRLDALSKEDISREAFRSLVKVEKARHAAALAEVISKWKTRSSPPQETEEEPKYTPGDAIPKHDWRAKLRCKLDKGRRVAILDIASNLGIVFEESPLWRGVLALNRLSQQVVMLQPVRLPLPERLERVLLGESIAESRSPVRSLRSEDVFDVQSWMDSFDYPSVGKDRIWDAFLAVARRHAYHPIEEYLVKQYVRFKPPIDAATATVESFLSKYMGAEDTEANRARSRILLLSAVARVLPGEMKGPLVYARPDPTDAGPGCLVKSVIVLYGGQNLGKSAAVRELCPDPAYFAAGQINFDDAKKAGEIALGKWLMEFPEFDAAFNRRDNDAECKLYISLQVDRFRPPYGKEARDYPRQFIIIGTTNKDDWQRDPTGLDEVTRYQAVRCGVGFPPEKAIDYRAIRADRDEIWAAAVACFMAGQNWWVERGDLSLREQMVQEQHDYRPDAEHALQVGEFLVNPQLGETWCCPDHIPLEVVKSLVFQNASTVNRTLITQAMQANGWRPEGKREVAGRRVRVWTRPKTQARQCQDTKGTGLPCPQRHNIESTMPPTQRSPRSGEEETPF